AGRSRAGGRGGGWWRRSIPAPGDSAPPASGRGRSRTVPAGWFRRDRQSSGTLDVLSGSFEAGRPASPADAAKQWRRAHPDMDLPGTPYHRLPAETGAKPALVSRFRGSQALAAHPRANFGIKGPLANLLTLVWFLDLKFLREASCKPVGTSNPPHWDACNVGHDAERAPRPCAHPAALRCARRPRPARAHGGRGSPRLCGVVDAL